MRDETVLSVHHWTDELFSFRTTRDKGFRLSVANDIAGPRFDLYSLIAEAAAQGLGIGLVPPFTVERDLQHGRLVTAAEQPPSRPRASHERGGEDSTNYYLDYPTQRQEDAVFGCFRDWLLQQCDGSS